VADVAVVVPVAVPVADPADVSVADPADVSVADPADVSVADPADVPAADPADVPAAVTAPSADPVLAWFVAFVSGCSVPQERTRIAVSRIEKRENRVDFMGQKIWNG